MAPTLQWHNDTQAVEEDEMTHLDQVTEARIHHQPRAARHGRRLSASAAALPLLGLITLAATPAHAARSWTATPDLVKRRDLHEAVRLWHGNALIMGTALTSSSAERKSAEIYVP